MWELDHQEGWMLNNWCFWTVVLEKTLHSPLDSKERKPVNLKEINAEYSLQELILRLKLQYCGHLMWRANSLKKTLILGKIEGRRRRGRWRIRWLNGITESVNMSLSKLWGWWRTGNPGMLQSMELQSQTQLRDWMTTINCGHSFQKPNFYQTLILVRAGQDAFQILSGRHVEIRY